MNVYYGDEKLEKEKNKETECEMIEKTTQTLKKVKNPCSFVKR